MPTAMTLPPTVKSEKNATHRLYRSSAYKLPVPISGEGSGAKGIFNLSGKDLLTPHEMALKMAQFFNLDASLIEEVGRGVFTQLAQRPVRTGLILEKAITELNYNPHSFDESMFFLQKQLLFRSF